MALNAYTASITIPSGTSGPVQYTESGLSGGKLLFMTSSNLSATGQSNDSRLSFGCGAPGTNEMGMALGLNHNASSAGIGYHTDNQVVATNDVDLRSTANLSQWITNGFELNVSVASDLWTYEYTLLAGSDITNVAMATFNVPFQTTGLVSYTPFTFQPDVLIFLTDTVRTQFGIGGNPGLSLGAATSTAQWHCSTSHAVISNTTNASKAFTDTACIRIVNYLDTQLALASLDSMLATGFRLNWTQSATDRLVSVVGIKGGNPKVGTFLQPTTNGIQSISMGIQPVMALIAGVATANNTITAGGKMLIGQCSANAQRAHAIQDDDAIAGASSRRGRLLNKSKVIQNIAWSGTVWQEAGPSASLSALTSTGIDLQWFDTDVTQRKFGYIGFGGTPAPPAAPNKGSLFRNTLFGS